MMHRGRVVAAIALGVALLMARPADTTPAPDGNGIVFVPWKVLNPGDDPVKGDLVLYWIPASRDDLRRSQLLTSRPLTAFAAQCVGFRVVRPDDGETIERLGATGSAPAAVLVDREGSVMARSNDGQSPFSCALVEKMVRESIVSRESEMDRLMDQARRALGSGDRDGAIASYRRVSAYRCLAPRQGREAQRALRRLGAE